MPAIKPVKVFTRDNPCTKVDLHNCFASGTGEYVRRPVVEAQGEIGVNSAKYLLKKEYAVYRSEAGVDYYELTAEGEQWLRDGLVSHLKRHLDDMAKVEKPIRTVTPVRLARTKL